jgi:hypothetical protein
MAELVLQQAILLLLCLHTAGRPSSFLPSSKSSFILEWSHIDIIPRRDSSQKIVGFDSRISLLNFKGAQEDSMNKDKVLRLYLRTVLKPDNLLFDLGAVLVALGLRRGIFGRDVKLDDLYTSDLAIIAMDPELRHASILQSPVDIRSRSATRVPMTLAQASDAFRNLRQAAGFLSESVPRTLVAYT